MWLLPTKGRIDDLRRFLKAARELATATPGLVLVNRDDYAAHQAEYDLAIRMAPGGWALHLVDADCYGEAVRQAWPLVKDLPWIGLVADDLVPMTAGWDTQLVQGVSQGWLFVSANDGAQANADIAKGRMHGAIVWAGQLARAVGWIFPPGLRHVFHDDVWETLGRATACWRVRMDVMTKHLHEAYVTGHRGPTMDPASDLWRHDEAWFKTWVASGGKDAAVERIRALQASKGIRQVTVRFDGVKVMLATPCSSARPEMSYVTSLYHTFEFFKNQGVTVQWQQALYTADISLARMQLFSAFLHSDCTHLLLIDDDMGWTPEALVRLFAAQKDFVAIAGPKKRYPLQFAASHTDARGNPLDLLLDTETGVMEVSEIGAAFCLLTRSMCEAMAAGYPDLACDNVLGQVEWAVFNPQVWDRKHHSEDFAFCKRWRLLGGKVYMVHDVRLKHTGAHTFEGCFADVCGPAVPVAPPGAVLAPIPRDAHVDMKPGMAEAAE